jgi:hypothetical protein
LAVLLGRSFHVKPKPKGEVMAHFHKVNVTYHAPPNDSKVCEMMNTTFYDGTPVDVICTMEEEARLENNPHFQINSSSDYDPGDAPPPARADPHGKKSDEGKKPFPETHR